MGFKEIVIGSLQWILIVLLLSIPIALLAIYKLFVVLLAKVMRKDLKPLDPMDYFNAPGSSDEKSVVNFGFVCKVDGEINLEQVKELFASKFLDNSDFYRFRSALVIFCGHPFFKMTQIDINDHILEKHLAENERLEEFLSDWLRLKYKKDCPCWGMIVVPLKATGQTAIGFKIHHAFADGYSVLYILDQLTQNTSPYLVKDFEETWIQKISQTLQSPSQLSKLAGDVSGNPLKVKDYNWMIGFTRLDLNNLKKIRRKHNVHFAPILLSLMGGALKRHLLETKKDGEELPKHITMATTLPWPRHPAKNIKTPPNKIICNHWVVGVVKVPIGEELDAVQRLLEVDKSLEEFQNVGLNKFTKRILAPLFSLCPVALLAGKMVENPGFGAGFTSTVGGDNYKFLGKNVSSINQILSIKDISPFLPVSVFSFSHSGHFDLTFGVNPENFDRSSLDRLLEEHLPQELQLLE